MSEIKLNLLDSHTLLTATVHGSVGDALVAALSAEPQTIHELETALKRFNKCESIPASSLQRKQRGPIDERPWDAGILVIDLAARMVASESTYSQPMRQGTAEYHDGTRSTGFPLSYLLSDDWQFAPSMENYLFHCDRRIAARAACVPLDTRTILYGKPLLEFIVENVQLLDTTTKRRRKQHREGVVNIHRRWLMTPRGDLNGQSAREVLFAKRELIDFDLNSRMLQWSHFLEEPPSLSNESHAFRFAGYGTHEWVMYYDLVRFLIWEAVDVKTDIERHVTHLLSTHCCRPKSVITPRERASPEDACTFTPSPIEKREPASRSPDAKSGSAVHDPSGLVSTALASTHLVSSDSVSSESASSDSVYSDLVPYALAFTNRRPAFAFNRRYDPTNAELIAYLAQQQAEWLSKPNRELDDYIPAEVIDNERRRRPEAMTGRTMVVDEDCHCCKMMGDESEAGLSIYFCHFDGCNMEDEFAFSSFATLAEWKAEQRRFEEWSRKSERERQATSLKLPDYDDCEMPF